MTTTMTMTTSAFIYPMATHVAWAAVLYALLTFARAPAIWQLGLRPDGSQAWAPLAKLASWEPRISANLSNQFEWPVFFYAACLVLMMGGGGTGSNLQLGLSWLFIAGRMAHSAVQILTRNVRLRGLVFTLNFLAVLAMWGLLVMHS